MVLSADCYGARGHGTGDLIVQFEKIRELLSILKTTVPDDEREDEGLQCGILCAWNSGKEEGEENAMPRYSIQAEKATISAQTLMDRGTRCSAITNMFVLLVAGLSWY